MADQLPTGRFHMELSSSYVEKDPNAELEKALGFIEERRKLIAACLKRHGSDTLWNIDDIFNGNGSDLRRLAHIPASHQTDAVQVLDEFVVQLSSIDKSDKKAQRQLKTETYKKIYRLLDLD
jgi:hypothetical protein